MPPGGGRKGTPQDVSKWVSLYILYRNQKYIDLMLRSSVALMKANLLKMYYFI